VNYRDLVIDDGAVIYYRFEEPFGLIITDEILTQDATNSIIGAGPAILGQPGAFGSSLSPLFVDNSAIGAPARAFYEPNQSASVELWFNLDPGDVGIVFFDGIGIKLQLDVVTTAGILLADLSTSLSSAQLQSNSSLDDSQWHHVAIVYDQAGATAYMIVDGAQQTAVVSLDGVLTPSVDGLVFGGLDGAQWFNGRLDEFALYHDALTVMQLSAHRELALSELPLLSIAMTLAQGTTSKPIQANIVPSLIMALTFPGIQTPVAEIPSLVMLLSFDQAVVFTSPFPTNILKNISIAMSLRFVPPRIIRELVDMPVNTVYIATLKNAYNDEIEIPISNFQLRLRANGNSFLSITIPNLATLFTVISDRLDGGTLTVFEGDVLQDGTIVRDQIVNVQVNTFRQDQGARANTGTLSGNSTLVIESVITRLITNAVSISRNQGRRRIRAPIDRHLKPGDTVDTVGEQFVVGAISMNFSQASQFMDVEEL